VTAAACGCGVTRRAFLRALAAAGLAGGRRGRAARLLALDPVSVSRMALWAG